MVQKIEIQAVAIVFMESKYILPKDITNIISKYFFTYLPIIKKEKNIMEKIVLSIYKDNM